ncbi:hypothetical protein ACOMHN_058173 [Nucella lapillus]
MRRSGNVAHSLARVETVRLPKLLEFFQFFYDASGQDPERLRHSPAKLPTRDRAFVGGWDEGKVIGGTSMGLFLCTLGGSTAPGGEARPLSKGRQWPSNGHAPTQERKSLATQQFTTTQHCAETAALLL